MTVLRVTIAIVVAFYVVLWVLALNGASALIGPLVVPPVLAALVAMGVALQRFMGITPRKSRFRDREDDSSS